MKTLSHMPALFNRSALRILPLALVFLSNPEVLAQSLVNPSSSAVAVSFNGTYSQSFDSLASTPLGGNINTTSVPLPSGWDITANTYEVDNGSNDTNGFYSYGSIGSSDRSLGARGSTSQDLGVSFVNNTGAMITVLYIQYTGEEWYRGTGGADKLIFQYSTSASKLTDNSFTEVSALNFLSPNTTASFSTLDGNDPNNSSVLYGSISGLNIADGSTFWLRWDGYNKHGGGTQDGLGIDNFSVSTSPIPEPGSLALAVASMIAAVFRRRRRRGSSSHSR